MRLLLIVSALVAAACAAQDFYRGHQLLSVTPQSEEQVSLLRNLTHWPALDFWTQRIAVGEKSVIRVTPLDREALENELKTFGASFDVIESDVQRVVDAEAAAQKRGGVLRLDLTKDITLPLDRFLRYGEIVEFMLMLEEKYPDLIKVESFGKTPEGRTMYVAKISKQNGKAKRAVLVDAGIHAREWIAPATAVYLLSQLVENNANNAEILDGLDWYIVPVLNPDGYEYTHTTERLWRKNRSKQSSCRGVDLNRNFGFHWMENGASSNPCAETFAGKVPFSEIESQNFRDYVMNENKDSRIKMYLTLHSYGWYILYPWGYTSELPEDEAELRSISVEANKAMTSAGSQGYTIGTSTNVLYAAAGGSDDWAKGVAGIEKSYTIELPGGGWQGFDIPASKIDKTVKQVFAGLKVFGKRAKDL